MPMKLKQTSMKIHQCEQRTEEWFAVRAGKMTASNAQAIAANGKGLETYIYSLLAEKFSKNKESYTNDDIERGVELEEYARMTYEIEREKVSLVGFIERNEYSGCSPDGLVGKDGGVEIKCPNDTNFFKMLVLGETGIETKYVWQVQMCLLITGRKWWDIVFYNQNFEKNLIIIRIYPDKKKQEKLLSGLDSGEKLIREMTEKYAKSDIVSD